MHKRSSKKGADNKKWKEYWYIMMAWTLKHGIFRLKNKIFESNQNSNWWKIKHTYARPFPEDGPLPLCRGRPFAEDGQCCWGRPMLLRTADIDRGRPFAEDGPLPRTANVGRERPFAEDGRGWSRLIMLWSGVSSFFHVEAIGEHCLCFLKKLISI